MMFHQINTISDPYKNFIFFTFVICLCLYKYIGFLGYDSQFINHTLQISGLFAHYCESSFPSKFVISQYCYNSCATFGSLSMSCEVYKRIYKFSGLINPFQFAIPFNNSAFSQLLWRELKCIRRKVVILELIVLFKVL